MSSGFSCPDCGCRMSTVRNTIHMTWKKKEIIRRYRVCRHCGYTYATRESVSEEEPQHITPTSIPQRKPPQNPFV